MEGAVPRILGVIRGDTTQVLFGFDLAPLQKQGVGHSDLLVGNGRFGVYLYRGGPNFDTLPYLKFDSTNSSAMNDPGDVNGDGNDDVALLGRSPFGWKFSVYYGGNLLDTVRDLWFGLDSFTAVNPAWVCNNLRGDGNKYLVTARTAVGYDYGNGLLLFRLGTGEDSVPSGYLSAVGVPNTIIGTFGASFAVGDFNGDGITDLAVGLVMRGGSTRSGEVWIYFGGPTFDTIPNAVIRHPGPYQSDDLTFGTNVVCPGDLNGDGYDDLIVNGSGLDTTTYVYFGGPKVDTTPAFSIPMAPQIIHAAGDLNGDGYPDFICSTPLNGGGRVLIFYGGPHMTGQPDLIIHDWEIPGYHVGFGAGCTGIGDFDGDGTDDFAFTMIDSVNRGVVYIFSGWKATDVQLTHEPIIPSGLELHQNYPNPFNATTQIEFSIPRRAKVTLEITNIQGRLVSTIVNRAIDAGSYRATWDASRLASGVYFATLRSGPLKLTRKMILLK